MPLLEDAGLACVEDGAEVICMGSTTMHQAVPYLQERLPVPVINPGPLTYKLAELMLGLGLSQSRKGVRAPHRAEARDARGDDGSRGCARARTRVRLPKTRGRADR